MKNLYSLCLLILLPFFLSAQVEFKKHIFHDATSELPYRLLQPKNFDIDRKYPLLLFLHGAGERGNDNEKQLVHGGNLFLNAIQSDQYPSFILFPQCPTDDYWGNADINRSEGKIDIVFKNGGAPTPFLGAVLVLLDSMVQLPFIDQDRIYVGGLSMGGMGTFELCYRRPDLFAAAFPICGGGHPESVKLYANKIPLWIFHGEDDSVVSAEFSKIMVNALKAEGADPRFSLYPGVNHNSWDNAFAEPDFLEWIFSQKK
ncbi:dienelactone hydrolase family protein [Aquiflexum sp.]|uniref:carboxylesterase family protein n=1 Tax=Aquiflexum sp. TaxID=1872584 RepID=UPI0035932756